MKAKWIAAASGVFISAFICGVFIGTRPAKTKIAAEEAQIPAAQSVQQTEEVTPQPLKNEKYMLTLDDNGLSVYKVNLDSTVEYLYSKNVNREALRSEDISKLYQGITVDSEDEVRRILEDFVE